jgi:hypothetical protein
MLPPLCGENLDHLNLDHISTLFILTNIETGANLTISEKGIIKIYKDQVALID